MLELFRSFLTVLSEGSLNRAAAVLHITQPSLTRQMQSLEAHLGAPLLERQTRGVKPTALGNALVQEMQPVLERYDLALAELRRQARGQVLDLRIGYLGSAAQAYLNPALVALRGEHPTARIRLFDQSPGEQISALRCGEIDLALIGQEGSQLSHDFYTRRLATLGVCAVLASDHPLAQRSEIHAGDLEREALIAAPEAEVPGRNQWITKLCRRAGFRPRFVGEAATVAEAITRVAAEGAVLLLPAYLTHPPSAGVVLVPLTDAWARWDLLLLRQRGRASALVKSMENHLARIAHK